MAPGTNESIAPHHLEHVYLRLQPIFSWTVLTTGLVGLAGNLLTLLVYIKLGLTHTIHMSYAALALSDLCCVLTSMMCGLSVMKAVTNHLNIRAVTFSSSTFTAMIAGYPHMAFSRTTALLTAWISVERCLCVLFPTRVKLLISRTVNKAVIASIFIIGCCPIVLAYLPHKFARQVDPDNNSTLLVFYVSTSREVMFLYGLAFLLYGFVYPLSSWVTVFVCTTLFVNRLRQKAAWRKLNARGKTPRNLGPEASRKQQLSSREDRITKTVVTVASIFIVCSLPISANLFAVLFEEEYHLMGPYRYLYMINSMVCFMLSQLNSSLNVFVFALMGSKFRSVLCGMFS